MMLSQTLDKLTFDATNPKHITIDITNPRHNFPETYQTLDISNTNYVLCYFMSYSYLLCLEFVISRVCISGICRVQFLLLILKNQRTIDCPLRWKTQDSCRPQGRIQKFLGGGQESAREAREIFFAPPPFQLITHTLFKSLIFFIIDFNYTKILFFFPFR